MDKISPQKRSETMGQIRSKESVLEVNLRKQLWRLGLKYRKNPSKYFGKPDILIKKHKLVIFADSCFWHGCKKHLRMPASNKDYWTSKIERNRARDKIVIKYYKNKGWAVMRVWEHDLKTKDDIDRAAEKVFMMTLRKTTIPFNQS